MSACGDTTLTCEETQLLVSLMVEELTARFAKGPLDPEQIYGACGHLAGLCLQAEADTQASCALLVTPYAAVVLDRAAALRRSEGANRTAPGRAARGRPRTRTPVAPAAVGAAAKAAYTALLHELATLAAICTPGIGGAPGETYAAVRNEIQLLIQEFGSRD